MGTETNEVRLGRVAISALKADITALSVDAIVNSSNTRLTMGGIHTVAGAILRATGGRMRGALAQHPSPVTLGTVVATPGLGLPCKHVLHVATHASQEEEKELATKARLSREALRMDAVTSGIRQALLTADRLRLKSLAIPLLGTGSLQFPPTLAAGVTVAAAIETAGELKQLEQVVLVAWTDEHLLLLRDALARAREERSQTDQLDKLVKILGTPAGRAAVRALPQAISSANVSWLPTLGIVGVGAAAVAGATYWWKNRNKTDESAEAATETTKLLPAAGERAEAADVAQLRVRIEELERENARLRALLAEATGETAPIPVGTLAMPAAFAVGLVSSESDPVLRAANLEKAHAMLLRYLGALMLADYEHAGAWDPDTNEWLQDMLQKPPSGEGRWQEIALRIAALHFKQKRSFFSEVPEIWLKNEKQWSPLAGRLRRLTELRNNYVHLMGAASEAAAARFLEEALPLWNQVITHAGPLLNRRLLSVERVVDIKATPQPRMIYQVRWLMGDSFMPQSECVNWAAPLSVKRLYLADLSGERFLPLSPFLEYQHCDVLRADEAWSLERVGADTITFATFRFPHTGPLKVELPACLKRRSAA